MTTIITVAGRHLQILHPINADEFYLIFKGCGYDLGHMTPYANHESSQEEADDTEVLSNICPQIGQFFNRPPGIWFQLEDYCRKKAMEDNVHCLFIYTGPIYEGRIR